jgi:hypothetical protein
MTDGRRSVRLEIKRPSGAHDQIFITVRQLRDCWRRALSLMTDRFRRLQLLLVLVSAVILGSKSQLLSQIRDSPNLEGKVPVFISPGTGWPSYTHPSQNQSHIATDGQSISKSWCRAPSATHGQIFITRWQLRSCFSGRTLRREDWSVFWTCCWPSPDTQPTLIQS